MNPNIGDKANNNSNIQPELVVSVLEVAEEVAEDVLDSDGVT